MHLVVSGAAGHLARALLPALCAAPKVARVTGFDLQEPAFSHPRFAAVSADLRSAEAAALVRGADALVHLAWVVLRGRGRRDPQRAVNVEGSCRLLAAAAAAGARIVHVSSAAVYGSGEDLREDAPMVPLPGFGYAEDKAAVEAWIAAQLPQAAVLRPHIILGPHCLPLLRQIAAAPFYPRLPEPQPLLQCVHEADVAQAVLAALERDAAGPFNLAAPGAFSLREMIRHAHPGALPLPPWVVRLGLTAAWRLTGFGGEPGWLAGLARSLTLDCSRARQALGWEPARRDWRDILAQTLAG